MRTLLLLCDQAGPAGGAERYWETVVPALVARGIRVRILARETSRHPYGDDAVARVAWGAESEPPNDAAAAAVAAEIRRVRPDAIVTASVFDRAVLDAVHAAAVPWTVRLHDHRALCPTGDRVYPQFPAICTAAMGAACCAATLLRGCVRGPRPASFAAIAARVAVRRRIARADRILVSSGHMRATCIANGIAAERIAITPPPLPDAAFAQPPPPRADPQRLIFASRLTPRKGLRSLVAALARIAPRRRPLLVVAGSGEAEERAARADAQRSGVAVAWRGRLDAAALRSEFDDATAAAVPSLWPEPFGLVGIEAQARGRPAVAYDVGGIGDWIGDAGIAVARGDERALAGAIERIVEEPAWSAFARNARRRAESYRLDAHVARLLDLCAG
ncbi:hypothetical protein WPS_06520 [Vulcanimicrobium alpinum]|uniref:Glycosyltransferase n=1 Tax=Vulcanimicrobium alpinum TaxID=3016050 RepID=A0AAN1XVT3_UNVUL|nr:glycosyltransferase family 4 protein [Vulcanimicrobium alpinum]BDE05376.1 hypothetical protein WPS_06520 [Vulcanimicrobium alpinum]